MAVDDLPVAVLATVDLGDPQGVRVDWDAVDRHRGVFQLDRVGQVAADAGGEDLDALVSAVHRDAIERKISLTRAQPLPLIPAPNKVTGSLVDHIASRGCGSPL